MFTLKIMIGGKVVERAPNYTQDKLRRLMADFELILPALRRGGRVTVVAEHDGVDHLLGIWGATR
jgi:hypothetical protein